MSSTPSIPLTPETVAHISDDALLDLENQLCFAVYSLSHAFNRLYKALLKDLGLTYPQYLVMLVLWENEGVSVGAIGERLKLDSGTLTPLLKRMESAGLITRRRAADDERQVRVDLTEKGRSMRSGAAKVPRALLCSVGGDMQELDRLRSAFNVLQGRLGASADKGA